MENYKYKHLVLFVLAVCLLAFFFYQDTINEFPRAIHAWTQSDRYAIALNFIDNSFDFFHPATYNLKGKDGVTQVDFPIHEYLIAIIMKVTGNSNPVVFRLYMLLYSIIGLFYLFRLTLKITNDYWLSLAAVVFVFTLPVYAYYQNGFIPSVTAFATMLIAAYYLYLYTPKNNDRYFVAGVSFTTLAALTRLPLSIFLIALFGVSFIGLLLKKENSTKQLFTVVAAILCVGLYYLYNQYLAKHYGSIFWMSPLYIESIQMMKDILRAIHNTWITQYFTIYHYSIMVLAVAMFLFSWKKSIAYIKEKNSFVLWVVISFAGALAYFFANGRQYIDHDYYFIDSFQLPFVLIVVMLFGMLSVIYFRYKYILYVLLFCLLGGASFQSYSEQQNRYVYNPDDQVEIARHSFEGSDLFLDSIGVSRNDKLLVIQAYTYNTPFIYLKRMGHTVLVCRNGDMNKGVLKKEDIDYIVMPTQFIVSEVLPFAPYLMDEIEFYKGNGRISVYKRNTKKQKVDLVTFLNINTPQIVLSKKLFTGEEVSKAINDEGSVDSLIYFSPPHSYRNENEQQYGLTCEMDARNIFTDGKEKIVLLKAKIRLPHSKDVSVVLSVDKAGVNLFYKGQSCNQDYITVSDEWQDVFFQFVIPAGINNAETFKLYFLNNARINFWLDDVEFILYEN